MLNNVLDTWRRDRKPAHVDARPGQLGLDADEDKLVHAKDGLLAFFRQVAPQDEIGLTKFSAKVTQLVAARAVSRATRPRSRRRSSDIIPEDDTSIYDASV